MLITYYSPGAGITINLLCIGDHIIDNMVHVDVVKSGATSYWNLNVPDGKLGD
jgi:hypothetical protein